MSNELNDRFDLLIKMKGILEKIKVLEGDETTISHGTNEAKFDHDKIKFEDISGFIGSRGVSSKIRDWILSNNFYLQGQDALANDILEKFKGRDNLVDKFSFFETELKRAYAANYNKLSEIFFLQFGEDYKRFIVERLK